MKPSAAYPAPGKLVSVIGIIMIAFAVYGLYQGFYVAKRFPLRQGTVVAVLSHTKTSRLPTKEYKVQDDATGSFYIVDNVVAPYHEGDKITYKTDNNGHAFAEHPHPANTVLMILLIIIGTIFFIAGFFKIRLDQPLKF